MRLDHERGTDQRESVTEDQVQTWTEEAEAGYPVEVLSKRGRKTLGDCPGDVVRVRIHAEFVQSLEERADCGQKSQSDPIRAAIRA
ncbi:MAG: hypothetical protein QMB00_06565 [Candidatus Nanopelagicales bacterium]